MPNPAQSIEGKKTYSEMTDKQQDIVDLLALHSDDTPATRIAEEYGDASPSYVSSIRNSAQEIIERRREELDEDELEKFSKEAEAPGDESNANGRMKTEAGNVKFEGMPFNAAPQYFNERPNKNQLTEEQEEFVSNLDVSELEKRVIRTRIRNPEASLKEIAEMLEEKYGTVSSYANKHKDLINQTRRLPFEEGEGPVEIDEHGNKTIQLSTDGILDVLSSDVDRETKKQILSQLMGS